MDGNNASSIAIFEEAVFASVWKGHIFSNKILNTIPPEQCWFFMTPDNSETHPPPHPLGALFQWFVHFSLSRLSIGAYICKRL